MPSSSYINIRMIENKYCCIDVTGYFNADLVLQIKEQINQMIEQNTPYVILNLKEVSEMNSTVLGIIVSRLRRIRHIGGDIRVTQINSEIKQMFELIGADRIFEIFDTEEEAINSFK